MMRAIRLLETYARLQRIHKARADRMIREWREQYSVFNDLNRGN